MVRKRQKTQLHGRKIGLLEDALAALTRTTGLNTIIVAREPKLAKDPRLDAAIQIKANGKRLRFFAEIKQVDRPVGLAAVKQRLQLYGNKGILVAPYITAELANHCHKKLNLNFIDTVGNAYLRAPGLHIFIRGERPQKLVATGTRAGGTATALRIVFALLCKLELLNAPYRDIVAAAGVALGAVGPVILDLQVRRYITGGLRKRNRRFLEADRLLEEWVTNFPIKLRPKLNPRRFEAPNPDWWKGAHLEAGACWGGEVAAAKLTEYLKPAAYTIYVKAQKAAEAIATLVRKHRLHAAPHGDVEILETFWNFENTETQRNLVPPILIYADLMATLDPRNLATAKIIREQYIDHALRRA